ncbi:hypothetical protein pdam_00002139 [Pocillopora damicornis]|uniref:Uncharacterized protein n=1 Tax=Pocillopora damicornis TaxID=46731 RepID=A0A3M6U1B7_POCDA|nr:hypothetical protein pdam_00002139 [Pocillopora damicornis]
METSLFRSGCQLMENGESGANGPLVQRPAEAVTCQGAAHVTIQLRRMGAVHVKDPVLREPVVTIRNVQGQMFPLRLPLKTM